MPSYEGDRVWDTGINGIELSSTNIFWRNFMSSYTILGSAFSQPLSASPSPKNAHASFEVVRAPHRPAYLRYRYVRTGVDA